MGRTVLFLDFDGVLNPRPITTRPGQGVFTALELLEGVLRQVPHVEIVISSSWRERHELDELRDFFSPDLRERIVGVTVPGDAVEAPPELHQHPRHFECLAWLAHHRPAGTPWLAIDDVAEDFAPQCANLLLVDGSLGLTPHTALALLRRLGGAEAHLAQLPELARRYAAGEMTWREIADQTGAAFGDLIFELAVQGLQLPQARAEKTPAQQAAFDTILRTAGEQARREKREGECHAEPARRSTNPERDSGGS